MKFFTFNKNKNKLSLFINIVLFFFCMVILLGSVRGLAGNPTIEDLNNPTWKENGPFQLSNENGRFALTYAFTEHNTVELSPDLARFASPDVAYGNGRYLSLFLPGVSFIIIPGYLLGKMVGMAQLGAFLTVSFFALLNVILIRLIALRLGAKPYAANIASLAFLFASPAFAYTVTLSQHQISTFFILSCIYLLVRFNSFWSLTLVWFLIVVAIIVDYPNFFMLIPVGFLGLTRLFSIDKTERKIKLNFSLVRILTFVGVILPLTFFAWFNNLAYGNPFTLSGNLERVVGVNPDNTPVLESERERTRLMNEGVKPSDFKPTKSMVNAFLTRNLLQGFYIHFVSPDRGMLRYTPLMLLGFVGIFFAVKKRMKYVALLTGVIGFNIILYSMWGDPWGGWAFGSRYLVPVYSILSIFIAVFISWFAKKKILLFIVFLIMTYSICIGALGALTTNNNPPQGEAEALSVSMQKEFKYTYEKNIDELNLNTTRSFFFNTYLSQYLTVWNYYIIITSSIILFSALLFILLHTSAKGGTHEV